VISSNMDFNIVYSMLVMGFLTSISHCIGMCGGFIMAYSLNTQDKKSLLLPHVLYHSGRIITYTFLGAVFGLIGSTSSAALSVFHLQDLLFIFAGLIMVILGFEFAGLFSVLNLTKLPFIAKYQIFVRKRISSVNIHNIFVLGLILGFIPCGPVYVAGVTASTSGSIINGALTMAAFGIGTFPVLIIFGVSTNILTQKFKQKLLQFTAILVIILGLFTIYKGVVKWDIEDSRHKSCYKTNAVNINYNAQ